MNRFANHVGRKHKRHAESIRLRGIGVDTTRVAPATATRLDIAQLDECAFPAETSSLQQTNPTQQISPTQTSKPMWARALPQSTATGEYTTDLATDKPLFPPEHRFLSQMASFLLVSIPTTDNLCPESNMPQAGRHLGIDYGPARIGAAVSDLNGSIVSPLKTIAGTGSIAGDVQAVIICSHEQDPSAIIVGLPLNMDDTDSDQTKLTREFIAALTAATDLPVHVVDERLSTFAAAELMDQAGIPRNQRKQYRDQYAAVVIIRTYFAGRA